MSGSHKALNFALFYAEDAYSMNKKIMGRQSAGKSLMRGVARTWPAGDIHGFGSGRSVAQGMAAQLHQDGFRGKVHWHQMQDTQSLASAGALYYPAAPLKELAFARNSRNPAAYSLFGVTHTLASKGIMDQVADLALQPFQPWDALICTSQAALTVVSRVQNGLKEWMGEHLGVTRFNPVVLPVIPLGVNVPDFLRTAAEIADARRALLLQPDEVVFLSAGRLSFHAKANPVPFYQALEEVALKTGRRLVCLEAGVYPNDGIRNAYEEARKQLAPSVRFLRADGQDALRYMQAWRAADVFVSLSDNIQETFGLTPLEAMAAGLPVLVSDWDGYKDTVRDGVDGYRVPVLMAPPGSGRDLAFCHASGVDSYDFYIGRVSLATAVDTAVLVQRIQALAESPELREQFGRAAQLRAGQHFDWPVILMRYCELALELEKIRCSAPPQKAQQWLNRPDPFGLFSHYPTRPVEDGWQVRVTENSSVALKDLLELEMLKYGFDPALFSADTIAALHGVAAKNSLTVQELLEAVEGPSGMKARALMFLLKVGLVHVHPV
jgi:starch synthase